MKKNNNITCRLLIILGLIILSHPALAQNVESESGATGSGIIQVDTFNLRESFHFFGKKVRFKKHQGLPAPLCVAQGSASLKPCPSRSNEPEGKEGEGE